MSLVGTYVRATDGNLYEDPVLRGDGWFVCFDDDDPPELVLDRAKGLNPHAVLEGANIGYKKLRLAADYAWRDFAHEGDKFAGCLAATGPQYDFRLAMAYFFELTRALDPKHITAHDGCSKELPFQGVIYDFKQKGER